MFRIILSAVSIASLIATAKPAFADILATTASEQSQVVRPVIEQPAAEQRGPEASGWASPSDAAAAKAAPAKIVPVGFGWG